MKKFSLIYALTNFSKIHNLESIEKIKLYSILRAWIRYQKSLQKILEETSLEQYNYRSFSTDQEVLDCRFFITVHYGIYPLIYTHLNNTFNNKKIVCIIGQQLSIDGLKKIVTKYNLNIEFIEIGDSSLFYRELVKLNKQDCIFISLIDIPLGSTNINDTNLSFLHGEIKVKTGLLKIANKLNLSPRFIIHNNKNKIESYNVNNVEDIFSKFQEHLIEKPEMWDKITDLHKFYNSKNSEGTFTSFKLNNEHFIMDVIKNRPLRLSKEIYNDFNCIDKKTNVGKIYEQANINIIRKI